MTLSAVSNTVLPKNHISHQKTDTDTKQSEKSSTHPSSVNTLSGTTIDDNVTLSQSKKTNVSSYTVDLVDQKTIETLLHQSIKSILTHSKQAVSAQATSTPQVAQKILAEN